MRKFVLIQDYYFLAKGTVLKENTYGCYFVSMPDETWLASRIHCQSPKVEGGVVENRPDVFREVFQEDLDGRD